MEIRLFQLYPTYSYYRFDDTVIVAMYSITSRKSDVPAFELHNGDPLFSFFDENMKDQLSLTEIDSGQLSEKASMLRAL